MLSWSVLASGIGPVLLMVLFWKGVRRAGILAGIVTGFGAAVLGRCWWNGAVYELIPAFLSALFAIWLGSVWRQLPD
jgi:Na+/proline symporter